MIRQGIRVSTKGKEAMGVGISGATRIVNLCKGKITINSQLEQGTKVVISLPRTTIVPEKPENEIQLDDNIDLF